MGNLIVQIKPLAERGMDLSFGTFAHCPEAEHGALAVRPVEVDYVVSSIKSQCGCLASSCHMCYP